VIGLAADELRRLYVEELYTHVELANHFAVSSWTIRRNLKAMGINRSRVESRRLRRAAGKTSPRRLGFSWLTRELLQALYHDEMMSLEKIAVGVRVSARTVRCYMLREGVVVRPKREAHKAHFEFLRRHGDGWYGAVREIIGRYVEVGMLPPSYRT